MKIKKAISKVDGVKDVILDENEFSRKITVYTSSLVTVKDIEHIVIKTGFHAIPKSLFEL